MSPLAFPVRTGPTRPRTRTGRSLHKPVPEDFQQAGPPTPDRITGIVLCGGESRRMGEDKAALEVGGEALLDRAVRMLLPRVREIVLACGPEPRYTDRGLRLALDGQPGLGPLEGLRSGLSATTTDWALALACDMPAATEPLEALLRGAHREDQIVHFTTGGYPEPLCALYHRSVLPALEQSLRSGGRRMLSFWSGLRVRALDGPDDGAFANVNTRDDLARARDTA